MRVQIRILDDDNAHLDQRSMNVPNMSIVDWEIAAGPKMYKTLDPIVAKRIIHMLVEKLGVTIHDGNNKYVIYDTSSAEVLDEVGSRQEAVDWCRCHKDDYPMDFIEIIESPRSFRVEFHEPRLIQV